MAVDAIIDDDSTLFAMDLTNLLHSTTLATLDYPYTYLVLDFPKSFFANCCLHYIDTLETWLHFGNVYYTYTYMTYITLCYTLTNLLHLPSAVNLLHFD